MHPSEPFPTAKERDAFWERRIVLVLLLVLTALPMVWPNVPPLLDLPGHMGRYRVQLDLASSPALQQFYMFDWRLIGNLGVDLLVELLAPLIGLELAVRLIVLAIPPLTAGGLLWVAHEVHGRIPPTTLFALPFAYNFPFFFGFANFALSMALALLAFALWLRLARKGRPGLRAILFVPISMILWVVHAFGWGTLGVLAFSAELVRQFDQRRSACPPDLLGGVQCFVAAGFFAGLHCLALAPPLGLMLLWRSEAGGQTGDWFNWERKWEWVTQALRDRWEWFDLASVGLVSLILAGTILFPRSYSRNLLASTLFLIVVFILLPRIVFGSAYADMRLAPYLFAIGLVAIRFPYRFRHSAVTAIGIIGLSFFLVRTAATTASTWIYDQRYDRELAALAHVPHGARMVSFVGRPCTERWAMTRLLHLPAMAIVRREAFSNDQWTMAGAQLLQVRYRPGWPFIRDASQVVTYWRCRNEVWRTIDVALKTFPRHGFDYVWLIDPPRYDPALTEGLTPIWRDGTSVLYRVDDRSL
ncbi:hypothetical protein RCO27_06235 [Sphingosinicella sp. LHD-64]|uniref:hypothetical protein n=1 Tax=Sphingosinicella sp. LHD-64 TaxID=3072139 RepID=UPI00280F47E7|nr:hypothetical protein [Sphingosinicella sp. LHD-64]MDQ8755823.1 hypothetical protein [Sphingosinicella sp. LHD-64]